MCAKDIQQSLFSVGEEAALLKRLLSLPKIDLHRHLTGSINATMATRIAAKHDVSLPTYIASELDEILYGETRVRSLKEYFSPWRTLNGLFASSLDATREIVLEVIKDAAEDNVVYAEIRMGPHGFLGNRQYSFSEFVKTVAGAASEAETRFGTVARCILGIPRHVFGPIPSHLRNRMFAQMISAILPFHPQCFVGVDLNGDEAVIGGEEFRALFKIARDRGLGVTAHAGECGPAANVRYAVERLNCTRIGHGLAALSDIDLLQTLAERDCALELCPTSNQLLGLISEIEDLPMRTLREWGVPFIICTDNPARCKTTLSEELFKVAKAFQLSFSEIANIAYASLKYSFADPETKKAVELKLEQGVRVCE